MSASAPAGRMTRKTGSVVAACTRLTISGASGLFMVSCVMSQPAPTFCIQVPMYEMMAAIHRDRNRGSRKGAKADPCGRALGNGLGTESAISLRGPRQEQEQLVGRASHDCATHVRSTGSALQ